MNEILKLLNELSADELEGVIMRAKIMVEKKRKEEAEKARLEEERRRQEKIERERQRQAEIAELQRRLQELQSQSADVTVAPMQRPAPVQQPAPAPQPVPVPKPVAAPQPAPVPQPTMVTCPACGQKNTADSMFCASCGQRIGKSQPVPQQPAAPVAPVAPAKPAPAAQVRKPDESVMKWEKLPGETVIRAFHEIVITKPAMENKAYYMEVTNKRILLSSQSVIAKNAGAAFGLVGSLVRELAHAGPKPCLEIPLAAVSDCGEYGKKEYFIEADQTYILKNKGYDKFLPDLVAKAKQGGY